MIIEKRFLQYFFVLSILVIVGLLLPLNNFSVIVAISTYLTVSLFVEKKSNIHMMFFIGFSTFLFLPSLLNWHYLNVDFSLFFLSSIVSSFFLFFTKNTKVKVFKDYGRLIKVIFIILSFLMIFLCIIGLGEYLTSFFAFCIFLLSLCFIQNKIKNNILFFFIFFLVFCSYIIFSWSGFGRTVLFGWLLLALLQFLYSINISINKYIFGLLPGLSATLLSSRNVFNLNFSGFEDALNDSAYGPYRLASEFIDIFNKKGIDFLGFFDQVLFTFFIFIPRSIWSDKPYGFGFEYTVHNLDASLVDAGHSIASTLIGEHLYYLGYLGILTSLIIFYIIAVLTNVLYRIKGLNGNGVLLFSASMMVLVWGGMTSFAARVALPTIIFLILFIILRKFLTNKIKITWGS